MNRLDYTWNLLFNHIFKGDSKLNEEDSYIILYEDKKNDFNIGWWIGSDEFQWSTENRVNIIKYPEGMIELDDIRKRYSDMSDDEFDRFCDVFGCLSNIESYKKE